MVPVFTGVLAIRRVVQAARTADFRGPTSITELERHFNSSAGRNATASVLTAAISQSHLQRQFNELILVRVAAFGEGLEDLREKKGL